MAVIGDEKIETRPSPAPILAQCIDLQREEGRDVQISCT